MTVSPALKNSPTWRRDVGNASMESVVWTVPAGTDVDVSANEGVESLLPIPAGWEIHEIVAVVRNQSTGATTIDVGIKGGDEDHFFNGQAINATGRFSSLSQTRHKPYRAETVNQELQVKPLSVDVSSADSVEVVFYIHFVDRGVR